MPADDPTDPNPGRKRDTDPERKRFTVNMSMQNYATLERLARYEGKSVQAMIVAAANTRWALRCAERPSLFWSADELASMPTLPNPAHYERVDDVTGARMRIELH